MSETTTPPVGQNFLRALVASDQARGAYGGRVVTRFPPEPNGYLHIGHVKSICLNFGLAQEFGGITHLRYDDTNPATEEPEYVQAILNDVKWLGFDPGDKVFFASDYFQFLYDCAHKLIDKGLAYVCDLSEEQIREFRGTVTEPGKPSPGRERSIDENRDLFTRMRNGEFAEGTYVLRARIDMASPNMKMRDPLLYRIKKEAHHRTGREWPIYPFYDFAHCLSDATERITHSICTLEFENNRELYDWIVDNVGFEQPPHQHEFAKLNVSYTLLSKRRLIRLVKDGLVRGWDDPRMPTIAGMRRRGITPEALRAFAERVGVARAASVVDVELLDGTIRDDLNTRAPRVMAVLRPLEVEITNWPGESATIDAPLWPHDVPNEGSRALTMSGRLFIDHEDFRDDPPAGWHRLAPGKEVRLRYGYVIRCDSVVHDGAGRPAKLRCTVDLGSLGGKTSDGRKVKGIIHWVDAATAKPAEVRLYDRISKVENPNASEDFLADINRDSLEIVTAQVEPLVAGAAIGTHWQFERVGYFFVDPDTRAGAPVFNRVVGLKDGFKAEAPKAEPAKAAPKAEVRAEAPRAATEKPALSARAAGWVASGVAEDAARAIDASEALSALFTAATAAGAGAALAGNLTGNLVAGELSKRKLPAAPFDGAALAALCGLVQSGAITLAAARTVLGAMFDGGGSPAAIVAEKGLAAMDDAALHAALDGVLAAQAAVVARYRAGEAKLWGVLVGAAMKATQGRADAEKLNAALKAKLEG